MKASVVLTVAAPDGVRAPVLSSVSSRSVRAHWLPVARDNADQSPAYQLQFTDAMTHIIEK